MIPYLFAFFAGLILLLFIFGRKRNKHDSFELTEEFEEILNILNSTKDSIFITGKAGTGKSTLLNHFRGNTDKKHVLLAPTGIAALNVGGQTIHSFFRFPPSRINAELIKPDYVRGKLFESLEMVIIDEVSMVRVDMMNAIDMALRKNRGKPDLPFGGVQMVFVGDLYQLPPVITDTDRDQILLEFGGGYFFDAPVFAEYKYEFKELTTVFRQDNDQEKFKGLLNNIRTNSISHKDMVEINSRHRENAGPQEDSVFLTTKKSIARDINLDKLELLPGEEFQFEGEVTGQYKDLLERKGEEYLEGRLPAPYRLRLKVGAQVMMLRNDQDRRWVNGSIGTVEKMSQYEMAVRLGGKTYEVEPETWKEVIYQLNSETGEIEEKPIKEFTQFPMRLAYAMTIHKSQGKTFEKITLDIGRGAFAHGQIYVALSRCKSFEGIVLNNPIHRDDIIVDPRVAYFYKNRCRPKDSEDVIRNVERRQKKSANNSETLKHAIENQKRIKILYQKYSGGKSERVVSKLEYSNEFGGGGGHIKGFCHLRNEERNFKVDRIQAIEILEDL